MNTLRELLESDPLAVPVQRLRIEAIRNRFGRWIAQENDSPWLHALSLFALDEPWTYWDEEAVGLTFELLCKKPEISVASMHAFKDMLGRAIANIRIGTPRGDFEFPAWDWKQPEILRLAHEFNPQYLRVAEHIFGNPELVNAPETGAVRN